MSIWIYDAGHGVDTAGKRSPEVPPGIREWEFNRAIVRGVKKVFEKHPSVIIVELVPEDESETLHARLFRIQNVLDAAHSRGQRSVFVVSCHANAAPAPGWSEANGIVVARRAKRKNPYPTVDDAHFLSNVFLRNMGEATGLSTKRGAVDRGYTILMSKAPSILVEHGFMTNLKEASFLASEEGREKCIEGHKRAILEVESRFK